MTTDARKDARIADLVQLVRHHRYQYYNMVPQIPDDVFDAYVDELRALDSGNPALSEVGAPHPSDTHWITGEHKIPMTSLDKVNEEKEMLEWLRERGEPEICIQEKLDGLSISLDYEKSILVRVLTRGAGVVGEDVTRNVAHARGIPQVLPCEEEVDVSIRGEIILTQDDFDVYNKMAAEKGWTTYQNKRNGASGLTRRLSGSGRHFLSFRAYDLVGAVDFDRHSHKIDWLISNGFTTPHVGTITADISATLVHVRNEYQTKKRASLDHDIDGLVIKVDRQDVARDLDSGRASTSNPRSQIAWKFDALKAVTTLRDVQWQVGETGRITPVAILDPVPLGGVTIERASVYNWNAVKELGLHIGCQVLIKRANDVIPAIDRVVGDIPKGAAQVIPPTKCPDCGTTLTWNGAYLVCSSTASCPSQLSGLVRHWVKNLEIDFVGEKLIEGLVSVGKVRNPADLYRLSEADISSSPGGGVGIARRAIRNLEVKRRVPLHILVGSIGIPSVGRSLAKVLTTAPGCGTLAGIIDVTEDAVRDLPGFGPKRAKELVAGVQRARTLLLDLASVLDVVEPGSSVQKASGGKPGASVCVTGTLSRPRKDIQQMVEAAGLEWETSVRRGLTYLVAADPSSGSSKLKKAQDLGVKVISEDELARILTGGL